MVWDANIQNQEATKALSGEAVSQLQNRRSDWLGGLDRRLPPVPAQLTVRFSVAFRVSPPETPCNVSVWLPVAALLATVMVIVAD